MSESKVAQLGRAGAAGLAKADVDPLKAVTEMVAAYRAYQVTREQEVTKRRQIEADEAVALAEIASRRELVMEYLRRSFDERAENFQSLFKRIDEAVGRGDVQALALLANSLVELAKSSPFKDLASVEATRQALKDKDHNWNL